ncbi:hypothetical protein [Caldimonas brevitalea]|nr:hypothetical protein [Caldimonas brevitalea]
MHMTELSLCVDEGGKSYRIPIGNASVMSPALDAPSALVTVDVNTYVRKGKTAPAADRTGKDILLLAGNQYRLYGWKPGERLAFATQDASVSGVVHLTEGV